MNKSILDGFIDLQRNINNNMNEVCDIMNIPAGNKLLNWSYKVRSGIGAIIDELELIADSTDYSCHTEVGNNIRECVEKLNSLIGINK